MIIKIILNFFKINIVYIFNVYYNIKKGGIIMKKVGRPKGKNKDTRLNIMISSDLKNEFQKIVSQNGSNISVKTCELIINYIKEQKGEKQ